jgi:hypothetical protein
LRDDVGARAIVGGARGVGVARGRDAPHVLGLGRGRPEAEGAKDGGQHHRSHAIHGSFSRERPVNLPFV